MSLRALRRAGAVTAAVGTLLSLSLSVAPSASAQVADPAPAPAAANAGVCEMQDLTMNDTIGNNFTRALYCDNLPADLYGRPSFDAPLTGWLVRSPSHFACWTVGPKDTTGSPYWYYVQGDRVGSLPKIKGWGSLPAEKIKLPAGWIHPVATEASWPTQSDVPNPPTKPGANSPQRPGPGLPLNGLPRCAWH